MQTIRRFNDALIGDVLFIFAYIRDVLDDTS